MSDSKEWQDGNVKYANFLANNFKQSCETGNDLNCCEMDSETNLDNNDNVAILKTEDVPSFEKREYSFAFKRLPVVRLSYDTPEKTNLYIETPTSRLAAKIKDADRYEGYSFAIMHKFLFMDWENVRDVVAVISALGVLAVSVLGVLLFFKK